MKKKSYQQSLQRAIQRGAFLTFLTSMLLVPHFAEEVDEGDDRMREELSSLQAQHDDSQLILSLLERYGKQMTADAENISDDDFPDGKSILRNRAKALGQSQYAWNKLQNDLRKWAQLRGGAGDPDSPLSADELKKNLQQQRALEICTTSESMSAAEEFDFLKAYDADASTATMMKYADPSWSEDDITLSDESITEHYNERLREAYKQRIEAVSSHPEKKRLIQLIKSAEKNFQAYAESCYDIGGSQPFRASKYIAAENQSRVIIWHLRDLDRYFPL